MLRVTPAMEAETEGFRRLRTPPGTCNSAADEKQQGRDFRLVRSDINDFNGDGVLGRHHSAVTDPLVLNPIEHVNVEFKDGRLLLKLSAVPNTQWICAFRNLPHYQFVLGKEPNGFVFDGMTQQRFQLLNKRLSY